MRATAAARAPRSPDRVVPPVARPSVSSTTIARRCGSRTRSRSTTSRATPNPAANGVFPPVGSAANRRTAMSTDVVGGSTTDASAPRMVITATLSRRW